MVEQQLSKGPWTHRVLVHVFTIALTALMYWLLGFVINDIGSWPGPDYSEVEQRLLDPQLLAQEKELAEQIAETERNAPYTCPMCGTKLYEKCESCHSIRHSLLPACETCGREKPLTPPVNERSPEQAEELPDQNG